MGGELWRTGVERGTEAEQQGEKDTEAGGERRCNAGRMWERRGQSQNMIVWSNQKSDEPFIADVNTGLGLTYCTLNKKMCK